MLSYWGVKASSSGADLDLLNHDSPSPTNRVQQVRRLSRARSPRQFVGDCSPSKKNDSPLPTNTRTRAARCRLRDVGVQSQAMTHGDPRLRAVDCVSVSRKGIRPPGRALSPAGPGAEGLLKLFYFLQNFDRPQPNPYTSSTRITRRERHVQVTTADHPRSEGH